MILEFLHLVGLFVIGLIALSVALVVVRLLWLLCVGIAFFIAAVHDNLAKQYRIRQKIQQKAKQKSNKADK